MSPENMLVLRDDSHGDSHDESTTRPQATATKDLADSTKESELESTGAKGDAPKSTFVTEESTITDSLTTRTDSGRTVTVPNHEVVTVIRHTTVITRKRPAPTSTVLGPTIPNIFSSRSNQDGTQQTSLQPPAQSGTTEDSSDSQGGGPLSTGAIIGIGIGGAAIVAFLVIIGMIIKRRFQRHRADGGPSCSSRRHGRFDEKHSPDFPQQMSTHTTGTQASQDPFAPFGGRADKEDEDPFHPASNAFEMEAKIAAPVELPDTSPEMIPAATTPGAYPLPPVADNSPTDPRANLNTLGSEDGRPKYVNHWNHYRSMSSG